MVGALKKDVLSLGSSVRARRPVTEVMSVTGHMFRSYVPFATFQQLYSKMLRIQEKVTEVMSVTGHMFCSYVLFATFQQLYSKTLC